MESYENFIERMKKEVRDFTELSLENINDVKDENIIAIQYAEPGAMGEMAGVYILTNDKNLYHTNYLQGYISLEVLQKQFRSISGLYFGGLFCSSFPQENTYFKSINLGFGNALLIKKEKIEDFKKQLEKHNISINSRGQLYQKWIDVMK